MDTILESIDDWICNLMEPLVNACITGMLNLLGLLISDSSTKAQKLPSLYSNDVYWLMKQVNDNIMLPIAGVIMSYVVCYELITMLLEKNNMAEMDVWQLYKWMFKTFITIELVTNAFGITMAFFTAGSEICMKVLDLTGELSDLSLTMTVDTSTMNVGQCLITLVECGVMLLVIMACYVIIQVTIIKRFFNIYIQSSVACIPYATWGNQQLNNIGMNYVKNMIGLAFQSVFMIIALDIYAVLVTNMLGGGSEISFSNLLEIAIYSLVLMGAIKGSDALSKSLFDAH